MLQEKKEVLLLTKNKFHAVLLQKETGKSFPFIQMIIVTNFDQATDVLRSNDIKGILIDADITEVLDLPAIQGLLRCAPMVPVVALTSDKSAIMAKQLFSLGIDELIIKDESFHVIVPKILNHVIKKERSKKEDIMLGQSRGETLDLGVLKATVSTLLHEINNPLMTILGMAELILSEEGEVDRELLKKVRIIEKSAQRIKRSTNRLANVSTPVYKKTLGGNLIDLKKSRISTENTVKLVEK